MTQREMTDSKGAPGEGGKGKSMQKVLKNSGVQILLAAAASYISILATLYYTDGVFWIFSSGTMALVFWLCLGFFYRDALKHISLRLGVISAVGGAVLGTFQTLGEMLFTQFGLGRIPIKLVGYGLLYAVVLYQVFYYADKWRQAPALAPGRFGVFAGKVLSPSRTSFLVVAGLLLAMWIPYYIINWPGLVSPDVKTQLTMWLGHRRFTSHHPIIHTAYLGLFLQLGRALGSEAVGLGLATLLQMVLMALGVSAAVNHLAVRQVNVFWRLGIFLFYGLFPVVGWYSTTLWKDVWLAVFVLLFYLTMVEVCQQKQKFFTSRRRILLLAVSGLGVILSKNNGIYLVLLTLVVCIITQKGNRKQLCAVFLAGLAFWMVLEGGVYSLLGVEKGEVREALSVPMLQIAKVVALAPETILPEEKALIAAVVPYDELPELYDPVISDPIKTKFKSRVFNEQPMEYLKMWVRLGLENPGVYIMGFLEHTSGYWFNEVRYWIFSIEEYTSLARQGNEWVPTSYDTPMDKARLFIDFKVQETRALPGFSLLYSVAFPFWLLIAAALYALYTRRKNLLPPMTVFFVVWLTCLASPVFAEYRYAYPAILSVPVVLGLVFGTKKAQEPKET